ncbi:2-phosphosulfolactate phosphatase [Methanobrevibacter sp. DSM 116169]|uniref:2-phosphosulfolactate phosphatase n=1 Tax=Methanobrevibacter sp. DSM 116169 TaxID=3242727 RepID=UPI0038FC5C67
MKITLSFEQTITDDVSILVDALRASTTITAALNNFNEIIPCFSPEHAFETNKKYNGVLAGERNGAKIEGFDVGNSPKTLEDYKLNDNKPLILTTTNGTRALEKMNSTVLIGSLINAKAVAKKSIAISDNHIDVVMAGRKGKFAIEDFLASGEILFWIKEELNDEYDFKISEYAQSAILARENYDNLKKSFYNSRSGEKLTEMGYKTDIDYCIQKNITDNVAIYENGILKLI